MMSPGEKGVRRQDRRAERLRDNFEFISHCTLSTRTVIVSGPYKAAINFFPRTGS
jgi:hypothetical protein